MAKVSILYHHFPHYRAPVMRSLAASSRHSYHFFGGHNDFRGIIAFTGDELVKVNEISFIGDEEKGTIKIGNYSQALSKEFDATIIIGNPNIRETWKARRIAHSNGLKVAFWAHGWLKKESWVRSKIRNYYFNKPDRVLVYGNRAIQLAKATGFDTKKISVVYNSLDWDKQSKNFYKLNDVPVKCIRHNLGLPEDSIIILTISRITRACRYDWLVDAVSMIKSNEKPICIVMIGDGPELAPIKAQAIIAGVDLRAIGALYEESLIAAYVMAADAVVSPGKVGLTAMHALAYGTPVVTHGDLDLQMPEVESIIDGVSGSLFTYGSIDDLARSILKVISIRISDKNIRDSCRRSLIGRFTPQDQSNLIDDAVDNMINE